MIQRKTTLFLSCLVLFASAPERVFSQFQTGLAGGGQPHLNQQPSLALNYIVRLDGTFDELGEVSLFAGNFAPRGWALAQGQLLPIAQNSALFSVIGTTYGGDGETTFALPDLRGRTALHHGRGPGLSNWPQGRRDGFFEVPLTATHIPVHAHGMPFGDPTGTAGGGAVHTNLQPSLAIQYAINTVGIFPSQNAALGDVGSGGGGGGTDQYLAEVTMRAGVNSVSGQLSMDGQLLPISQNQALFSLVGCTYGGDCETTFAVPDLRGRAVLGEGQGPGLSPRNLGSPTGIESVALSESQLPNHDHTILPYDGTTDTVGNGALHTNMQPSMPLNYIIALNGLFPSENAALGALGDGGGAGGGSNPFIGQLSLFAGNFAPRGWAFADGQILPIAQNTALFSLLGTTYGGDGETTFALPDLRGRTVVGAGTGPGLPTWSLGQRGGAESVALTINTMPAHRHAFVPEPSAGPLTGFGLLLGLHFRRRRSANSARM